MSFLKNIWKANSKHKKLSEELALQNSKENEIDQIEAVDTENDIVIFKLKYLGSTVVEKITGESISTEAVKNIVKVAKASRKKIQRVHVAISLKGISVTDLQGNDVLKVSIYRISNCSAYSIYRQIFSFISTDSNETMECHAFVCSNRKMAETVTLAVAHSFSTAFEAWRILPSTKEFEKKADNTIIKEEPEESHTSPNSFKEPEEKLIDFDEPCSPYKENSDDVFSTNQWVSFDDDFMQQHHKKIDEIFS